MKKMYLKMVLGAAEMAVGVLSFAWVAYDIHPVYNAVVGVFLLACG